MNNEHTCMEETYGSEAQALRQVLKQKEEQIAELNRQLRKLRSEAKVVAAKVEHQDTTVAIRPTLVSKARSFTPAS